MHIYDVHTWKYVYINAWTCTYMSLPCSDTYILFCSILSRWVGFQMYNIKYITVKYSSSPAKFRDLIREIKQRADLTWSWVLQMEMGTLTMSWDWNVVDVTAKAFKQSSLFHILIIDETFVVVLDSLAYPHSNRIKINFLSEELLIKWLTTWLIWLRTWNRIKLYCN